MAGRSIRVPSSAQAKMSNKPPAAVPSVVRIVKIASETSSDISRSTLTLSGRRQLRRLVILQWHTLYRLVLANLKRAASDLHLGRGAPSSDKTGGARRIKE